MSINWITFQCTKCKRYVQAMITEATTPDQAAKVELRMRERHLHECDGVLMREADQMPDLYTPPEDED